MNLVAVLYRVTQATGSEYILQEKREEMVAKDKPGFQIFLVPMSSDLYVLSGRQAYVNFLEDLEHLKLNVV